MQSKTASQPLTGRSIFDQDLQSHFDWPHRRQPIEVVTPPIL